MPTNPLAPVTAPSATGGTQSASSGGPTLGKDDFLKLLIGQMKNQDPLNPTDSSQYMSQMTQFSILEQITNLGQSQAATASNDYDNQAISLIGKTVTYTKPDLSTATGVVQRVTFSKNGPALTVGGVDGIDPVTVTAVTTS
jgi:flagellar basal-body rod modification protein FlgD